MIHHLALAAKDFPRSHRFYTEAMGFELVKVVEAPNPDGGGWTRHVFYDTGGGGLFALWDLSPAEGIPEWNAGISTGAGLPWWINHVAFECDGPEALEAHKQRWLDHDLKVLGVQHEFINSIYTRDPDGNLVEWTYKTRELSEAERIEAGEMLARAEPGELHDYPVEVFRPTVKAH
jgi:catechol 2,3-dioxygenase-like lactoylglutathione lyase family enzyme